VKYQPWTHKSGQSHLLGPAARLPRQPREDRPIHLNAVFTLKPKDGTAVAIMLII